MVNKFKLFNVISIYFLILNIVFTLLIYKKIVFINIIFYFLESVFISSIVCLATYFIRGKWKKIIILCLIFALTFLFIAQYIHYSFYDCFFSTYSLINGGQVFGFFNAILKEILDHILGIIIILLLYGILITIVVKIKEDNFKNKPFVFIGIAVICFSITLATTFISNNDIYSRKNLVYKTNSEVENTKKFGLIAAMALDFNKYTKHDNYNIINKNRTSYVFKESSNNEQYYNIDNSYYNKLTSRNNKNFKYLNTYFKNEIPTNKNEYTGIFKNKNLIFITAESFYFSAIDKDLTPTLYKMKNDSINFTNFYTPIYYASTSDGEYTNLTGLLPKEGTWSYIASKNNLFPYSYANEFNNLGYTTHSYHDGIYNFYNRDTVMPNFGYKKYTGCGNGLEKKINCNLWPQSDMEMFNKTFDDYKNDKNFMVYYMSISTHLSHDFNSNDIAKKHKNETKNLNYSSHVKAYMSALIELDQALENLINNLEKNNLLENTVITLVPDHYPYGLSDKELDEFSKLNNSYDKYKSGFIIYNKDLKKKKINKLSSNIDILPTLLNMFGIKYDSRLIVGKDIMSNSEGIVIFNDRSFLTSKGYYDEKRNEFISKLSVSNKYINDKKIEVYNKANVSSMLLDFNYYKEK